MFEQGKLVAFLPISDAARSRAFYEGILGLQFVADDDFALVMRSSGTTIRMSKLQEVTPAQFTVLGWDVADIRAEAKALLSRGVKCEQFGFGQDDLGIWTAPGGTMVAWFKDPDGNILSLSQHTPAG